MGLLKPLALVAFELPSHDVLIKILNKDLYVIAILHSTPPGVVYMSAEQKKYNLLEKQDFPNWVGVAHC